MVGDELGEAVGPEHVALIYCCESFGFALTR